MNNTKKYTTKKYLHFDNRINRINYAKVESYVTDPDNISEHSFFPLIKYTLEFEKYDENQKKNRKDQRPIKFKKRDIMYASHVDNFIYKHYGDQLNKLYNDLAKKKNIDDQSIAYRSNKFHKCNIDFAAEVINKISYLKHCFVIVGDFESFFDSLDHFLLKEKVKTVLGINYLKDDWYKVLKSITKYSFYEKETLNQLLGSDKEIRAKKQSKYFKSIKEYRAFRKKQKCCRNRENFGIPQGTAISAVLANVYAITFDQAVSKLVSNHNGIYRRYSDDFIIVLPAKEQKQTMDIFKIKKQIYGFAKDERLNIQEEKTELYEYKNDQIISMIENKSSSIDYLGFVFDGKTVKMRDKSPYKFYRNAYKLISKAHNAKVQKELKRLPSIEY